jgi:hypothetical protein
MELDKTDLTNPAAKRALDMGILPLDARAQSSENSSNNGQATIGTEGQKNDVSDIDKNEKDRNKRTKKDGAISSSLGSAESLEGSVRSQ